MQLNFHVSYQCDTEKKYQDTDAINYDDCGHIENVVKVLTLTCRVCYNDQFYFCLYCGSNIESTITLILPLTWDR